MISLATWAGAGGELGGRIVKTTIVHRECNHLPTTQRLTTAYYRSFVICPIFG
jgi:hypothetical protein